MVPGMSSRTNLGWASTKLSNESKTIGYRNQVAFDEPTRTKGKRIQRRRFPIDDDFGKKFSQGGGVHDAMPGRTIDQIEVWASWCGAKNRMFIRAHFVQTGPGLCWLDAYHAQNMHPFSRTLGNSVELLRIEFVAVVSDGCVWGWPKQHHASVAYAEVKPIVHENREGHVVGQSSARLCQSHLPA